MDFKSLVETKLEPVGVSGQETIYRCPVCEGDSGSGHLYVNYSKGYFNCFKCELSGKRIEKLLKILNISTYYDYSKISSDQDRRLDDILSIEKSLPDKEVDYSTSLPILTSYYNYHIKELSDTAYNYLIKRGLTPSLISSLGISEGVNRYGELINIQGKQLEGRDYSGRVMIPSLRKDNLISFYVGRDYIGDKTAKYMNPPKTLAVASEDVWSLDIIESNYVVICEGVMSAIAVNKALGKFIACATYGKSTAKASSSEENLRVTSQGEKLLRKKFSRYILFYDKDAKEENMNTCKYLYDRGAVVYYVDIPDNMYGPKADANDMRNEEIIDLIKSAKLYDNLSSIWL